MNRAQRRSANRGQQRRFNTDAGWFAMQARLYSASTEPTQQDDINELLFPVYTAIMKLSSGLLDADEYIRLNEMNAFGFCLAATIHKSGDESDESDYRAEPGCVRDGGRTDRIHRRTTQPNGKVRRKRRRAASDTQHGPMDRSALPGIDTRRSTHIIIAGRADGQADTGRPQGGIRGNQMQDAKVVLKQFIEAIGQDDISPTMSTGFEKAYQNALAVLQEPADPIAHCNAAAKAFAEALVNTGAESCSVPFNIGGVDYLVACVPKKGEAPVALAELVGQYGVQAAMTGDLAPSKALADALAAPAPAAEADKRDAERLDWLESEGNSLVSENIPTGGDDYEVRYSVLSYHMDKPFVRTVGVGSSPRAAIDAALAAIAAQKEAGR